MGKVMRHTLGASLNIRHNLSSSKGPKPLQLKLLTTYIPKTSAFTLAFSTSQRLRTTRASARTFFKIGRAVSRNAETELVCRLLLEITNASGSGSRRRYSYKDLRELRVIKTLIDALIKLASVPDVYTLSLHDALPISPAIKIVDHLHTKDERLYACL